MFPDLGPEFSSFHSWNPWVPSLFVHLPCKKSHKLSQITGNKSRGQIEKKIIQDMADSNLFITGGWQSILINLNISNLGTRYENTTHYFKI